MESNPGFASVPNSSPVNSEIDPTVWTRGWTTLYVSAAPLFKETMVNNVIHNNKPAQLTMDQVRTTNNDETIANMLNKEKKRKVYKKDMTTKRRNNEIQK